MDNTKRPTLSEFIHSIGMSQNDFAHLLGVHQNTIKKWVNEDKDRQFYKCYYYYKEKIRIGDYGYERREGQASHQTAEVIYILKGGLKDHCGSISWTAWFYCGDIVRGTTWTH